MNLDDDEGSSTVQWPNLKDIPLEWPPDINCPLNLMPITEVKQEPSTPPSPSGSSDSGCWPKTEPETPPVSPPRIVAPRVAPVVMVSPVNLVPLNGNIFFVLNQGLVKKTKN